MTKAELFELYTAAILLSGADFAVAYNRAKKAVDGGNPFAYEGNPFAYEDPGGHHDREAELEAEGIEDLQAAYDRVCAELNEEQAVRLGQEGTIERLLREKEVVVNRALASEDEKNDLAAQLALAEKRIKELEGES